MKRYIKETFVIVALFFVISDVSAGEISDSTSTFEEMKTLVGEWRKKGKPDSKLRIKFELTANNSVLVETWMNGGKSISLTIYHRDNETLMATHYCPQGNQPRMQMKVFKDPKIVMFDFHDVTNLKNSSSSHQHNLSFNLSGPHDIVVRSETYKTETGLDTSKLVLERITKIYSSVTE